jgi:hypothetical protein
MKHFVYAIDFKALAPAGGMMSENWFKGYKWMVEGELFLPILTQDEPILGEVEPGDRLWIVATTSTWALLGYVTILRRDESPASLNHTHELWYTGESCVELAEVRVGLLTRGYSHLRLYQVPEEDTERWLNFLKNTT